ncbi:crinkler family protein [Gigaspora margarita]|uniref:Crinkler family protein n=1 Tax=Gigaspora margarita TaxID=4874 RepID=A0A8H4A796_GIGMA|nr:crinkler family protein [Gigaspora margarita]
MSRSNNILSPVPTNLNSNIRYMVEITLFCYILSSPIYSSIPIELAKVNKIDGHDISLEILDFGHFKKLIWPNNNKANELRLWKFETPLRQDNKALKELNENFHKVTELGNELNPATKFLTEFPAGYEFPDNYIHIIALPPSPASTDQELTDVSHYIAKFGYLPRQSGLGGTFLPSGLRERSTNEGVVVNDPSISLRFDIVGPLIRDLKEKRVILVRAPPFSGKTSTAQILEHALVSTPEFSEYRVIRISLIWKAFVAVANCFESFGTLWKRLFGLEWAEWLMQCNKVKTILIIDEAQLIYGKGKKVDSNNEESADQFWMVVKNLLQEVMNLNIIMFAAYGYRSSNHTELTTPVTLPESNCKSLKDICFFPDELKKYVEKFCSNYIRNIDEETILKFYKYIKKLTEGHAGLVRFILMSTEEATKKRFDISRLTWEHIFKHLNSDDFNSFTAVLYQELLNFLFRKEKYAKIFT